MWDFVRTVLGEATWDEVALVAVFFLIILFYTWAPKIGEAVGGALGSDDSEV